MKQPELIAHRGLVNPAPENTFAAFQAAIDAGADGIELDVRLTADQVPVVYHYYYLWVNTNVQAAVFALPLDELRRARVRHGVGEYLEAIPTLEDTLHHFVGKIGLEIELKGPEPECASLVGDLLSGFKQYWPSFEVTSFEPALLHRIQAKCPGIAADLLIPRSEDWMQNDVVIYQAIQRGRLAHARAIHLHPSQLSQEAVEQVRAAGMEVHVWDVNDAEALTKMTELDIPKVCTDDLRQMKGLTVNPL